MAEQETVPNIDWGVPTEYGTAYDFEFTPLPEFPDHVRMKFNTTKGGEIEVAITKHVAMKLLACLEEVRTRLGLPLLVRQG
jgi:hypothetical protein